MLKEYFKIVLKHNLRLRFKAKLDKEAKNYRKLIQCVLKARSEKYIKK